MNNEKSEKIANNMYEWLDSLVFSLAIVMAVFAFFFQIYIVRGVSMFPTLENGDRVFVYNIFYTPKQGDVIVIDDNIAINESIIKRVIATENQTVDINSTTGEIKVDGVVYDIPIATTTRNITGGQEYPITVPEGCYFVMGDNRGNSFDSRYIIIGCVKRSDILGKAVYVVSPSSNRGRIR